MPFKSTILKLVLYPVKKKHEIPLKNTHGKNPIVLLGLFFFYPINGISMVYGLFVCLLWVKPSIPKHTEARYLVSADPITIINAHQNCSQNWMNT
jgi:hypothetical protein